ncbi:AGE family epimerase/isomerase [Pseudooceanicola algae]|uniref:Sulfoquinovose isomerase n=1 Tax=Pseudooceanicola algae TaxID=1537215 RepID=A0A418SHD0_9RHOB|nr:AGE family epimerase/isomerase [Pseudooceanicola algae]QPM90452.1 Sulfoquinovose isomerase [Pseudooceanicola algae]
MTLSLPPLTGTTTPSGFWLDDPQHRSWLKQDAQRQLDFFRPSLGAEGWLEQLDTAGHPRPGVPQELHAVSRLVHSYALGKQFGDSGSEAIIDAGMQALWTRHRDPLHGGYLWAVDRGGITDDVKLAYGQVFVLLAAASAKQAGHPEADRLLADAWEVLDSRYWDDQAGLFRDEYARDWTPFSTYRGMNANMHAIEAMLTAYEATDQSFFLERAGRILEFFSARIAPAHGWRLPEHYTETWAVDSEYAGNPMFRPAGTTPGHSLELGRLLIQHWDLSGRQDDSAPVRARQLIEQALADAWRDDGGFVYTLDAAGRHAIRDRYWWPVSEGIGAMATLIKLERKPGDELWYRRLWDYAATRFVDAERGGWYPEIDESDQPCETQFQGKPDIYHSLQAALFPLVPRLSRIASGLAPQT